MSSSKSRRNFKGAGDSRNKKAKKNITVNMSSRCVSVKDELKAAFDSPFESRIGKCSVIKEPFKCVVMPDFFDDNDFLRDLKLELDSEIEYIPKNNDLYQFRQTADLKTIDLDHCKAIRHSLLNQVQPFLKHVTGIELFDDVVDLTASKYGYTDVLLCHDDQLEERRIAFMVYLVQGEWSGTDGGTFDMFDRDANDQPSKIVRSISPCWNTFVFFEVTPQSYHQVAEILSQDKTRLSVNGWFRGPPLEVKSSPYLELGISETKCGSIDVDEDILRSWISSQYLEADTQLQVMEEFESTSEISLPDFLTENKYRSMCQLLVDENCHWAQIGPANRRKFDVLDIEKSPALAKELLQVFQSEAMFLIISNLSGIKLHPMAPDTSDSEQSGSEDDLERVDRLKEPKERNPRLKVELRKFSRGCYSLIHDHDPEVLDDEPKLDCILHFSHDFETDRDHGGFVSYIAKDADEELLAIEPQSNALSLVYRDKDTARFVKYLNDAHVNTYYDLNLVFQQ
ncbi:Prolyl 3-hydroxylase OGFOD1 [Halotydeus destructor]|nr:Prolyl 3-hydroxylase OGFOD1 [Halotydeus destructor]